MINYRFRASLLALLAATVSAMSLLVLFVAGKPAEAAFLGENGKIAFQSERDKNPNGTSDSEIYVMNPDGTEQINLTKNPRVDLQNPGLDLQPAFSPDGTEIAFVSRRKANTDVYTMDTDPATNDASPLTNHPSFDVEPAWSPDGTKIAFRSGRSGSSELYVMDAAPESATNQPRRLTNNSGRDFQPAWSPNGDKIAFRSTRDGNDEVYVMNADGTEQIRLTYESASDSQPNWSPDGTKIAFASQRDGDDEIYVMNPDGTEQNPLTDNSKNDAQPAWSADGKKVAFISDRGGNLDIYSMDATLESATNQPQRLTDNDASDSKPDWQPLPDSTPPEIEITTPPDGAEYKLGEAKAADYACSDNLSGVETCAGPVPSGSNIDTASVGSKSFTVEASDSKGNTAPKSHSYNVVYDFSGFFNPVDNPGEQNVFNSTKAGSAIPVKFGLSGDQGLAIFADGYPKSVGIPCPDSDTPVDPIEVTTSSPSGLSYDPVTGQYDYVWKTNRSWAGNSCRELTLKLKDGTEHKANFEFK